MNIDMRGKGFYTLVVKDAEGKVKRQIGPFSNLVTNQGLDFFGPSSGAVSVMGYCAVGTGNAPPAYTDTTLNAQLGYVRSSGSLGPGNPASGTYVAGPPTYYSILFNFAFGLGALVGNIAEIGVGPASGSPVQLFSRALILDGGGSPTTIALTSTDQLTVTYEWRWYLNTTDTSYSVTISSVAYSGIYRLANIASTPVTTSTTSMQMASCRVTNGTIGSITSSPSGTSDSSNTITPGSYSPGSYFLQFNISWLTGQGNVPGGITALMFTLSNCAFQFSVSPAIPKTSSQTMSLVVNLSWNRY